MSDHVITVLIGLKNEEVGLASFCFKPPKMVQSQPPFTYEDVYRYYAADGNSRTQSSKPKGIGNLHVIRVLRAAYLWLRIDDKPFMIFF